jgi:hypothetical protein
MLRVKAACFVVIAGAAFLPIIVRSEAAKPAGDAANKSIATFDREIKPLLEKFCYDCHADGTKKGGIAFDEYSGHGALLKDIKTWEIVLQNVRTHVMPPPKKPQPTEADRKKIARWIESDVFQVDCNNPDPGRVTIRRLNRVEYNHTIRDLVGVDFQPADDFPPDDSGYGFDNIGDVLSLPPVLLERYLAAADKILNAAIVSQPSTNGPVKRFEAEKLESNAEGGSYGNSARAFMREGEAFTRFNFPSDGVYVLRARAFAQQAGTEPARLEFRLDDKPVKVLDVTAVEKSPQLYDVRLQVAAGEKKLACAYINNFSNPKDPNPDNRDRNLFVDYVEVIGPVGPQTLPESHRRIFVRQPAADTKAEVAREIIGRFAKRAYRRPVEKDEVGRLMKLFQMADGDGETFEASVKLALKAVLVSPHFLFRGEIQPEPNNPSAVHPVNEYALGSRLSYFLWSSMPDDELFAQADRGTLRKNIETQVIRMLKDPKSKALVENFAGQWLQTRNLKLATPDWETFPEYNKELREAMAKETELFFENIMREDRSVLEFLDADYTFLNGQLARHYGISAVHGDEFRRVSLKGSKRGGILTHASVLTITSNPTRTSPVKRGKWVLENILGSPPPPPPADVPDLSDAHDAVLSGSLRQRMEQHRAQPMCASCHARMDPIGFGMENFNGVGGWREVDGKFPIDPTGTLVSGESFKGLDELKSILLLKKKEEFIRCLSEKMLTYALGRGVEHFDVCALDQIGQQAAKNKNRFSAVILGVIKSTPFQMRRGERAKENDSKAESEVAENSVSKGAAATD